MPTSKRTLKKLMMCLLRMSSPRCLTTIRTQKNNLKMSGSRQAVMKNRWWMGTRVVKREVDLMFHKTFRLKSWRYRRRRLHRIRASTQASKHLSSSSSTWRSRPKRKRSNSETLPTPVKVTDQTSLEELEISRWLISPLTSSLTPSRIAKASSEANHFSMKCQRSSLKLNWRQVKLPSPLHLAEQLTTQARIWLKDL